MHDFVFVDEVDEETARGYGWHEQCALCWIKGWDRRGQHKCIGGEVMRRSVITAENWRDIERRSVLPGSTIDAESVNFLQWYPVDQGELSTTRFQYPVDKITEADRSGFLKTIAADGGSSS